MFVVSHHPLMIGIRAASTASSIRGSNVKTFEIYRYNPEMTEMKPHLQVSLSILYTSGMTIELTKHAEI
jgi:hypothetical protein